MKPCAGEAGVDAGGMSLRANRGEPTRQPMAWRVPTHDKVIIRLLNLCSSFRTSGDSSFEVHAHAHENHAGRAPRARQRTKGQRHVGDGLLPGTRHRLPELPALEENHGSAGLPGFTGLRGTGC